MSEPQAKYSFTLEENATYGWISSPFSEKARMFRADHKFHIPFQSVYGSASFIHSACAAIHYQKKLGASSFYGEN